MVIDASPQAPGAERARLAVLVSGAGSNMITLADAVDRGEVAADIVVVVSDVADAPALERAQQRAIPTACVPFDRGRA